MKNALVCITLLVLVFVAGIACASDCHKYGEVKTYLRGIVARPLGVVTLDGADYPRYLLFRNEPACVEGGGYKTIKFTELVVLFHPKIATQASALENHEVILRGQLVPSREQSMVMMLAGEVVKVWPKLSPREAADALKKAGITPNP